MNFKTILTILPIIGLYSQAFAEDIVRCESNKDRRTYCDVRHAEDANIEIDRQLSDTPCTEGFSWGRDRRGIWVDRGCRAEFAVYYDRRGGYDNYDRRGGYDNYDRRCGNDNYDQREDKIRDEKRKIEQEKERLEQERQQLEAQKAAQQAPKAETCPSGFSPSERKCSVEERRRGCKDMRLPGGLGCVKR